jgi:pilus assembly protein CpaC
MKTTIYLRLHRGLWGFGGVLALVLGIGTIANAQSENNIQVNIGESVTLAVESVAKLAIADPTIADIVSLSDRELSVIGKKVGATTLTIVRSEGKPTQIFRIDVGNDSAAAVIRKVVGSRNITVRVVGDTIVLDGKVDDELDAQRAALIANAYYKDKVVNLLEISKPRQIKIRTRIAEVQTDAVKHMGMKWFGPAGEMRYSADFVAPGSIAGKNFGASYISGLTQPQANGGTATAAPTDIDSGVEVVLQLLETKGYAKLLSEPTLVTYNGKEASFLVGQQWPIVQQLPQSFTVEFKDVGVRMKIKPTADSQNQINTSIHAEVSQVIGTTSAFDVPIIGIKQSDTTLQVRDGQTIVIAGLLENNINRDTLRKLPWLAEIPIFGFLFRNKEKEQTEREVLFFVTPSVVKDLEAEVGGSAKTPVMKYWLGKGAEENFLEEPNKNDDWGMHNFDHMGFPHSDPAPKPASKAQPASSVTPAGGAQPENNFSPARPAGQ